MTDATEPELATPRRKRRFFSLIWLIPAAAALSALWLGYQSLASAGPEITITFDTADGLDAGRTKIRYKDVDIGTVKKVAFTDDLKQVRVTAEMTRSAEPFLKADTRFWVVKPRVTLGQVSGLSTILSGAYITLNPGKEGSADTFSGLAQPPVLDSDEPGRQFTLLTDRLNSLSQGSPIYFHGVPVGEVLGTELKDQSGAVEIYVFVKAPHDKLVRPETHFWNVSGFSLSAGAQGVRLSTESLQSLLLGGIEFDTPNANSSSQPSPQSATFPLYPDQSAVLDQPDGPEYRYAAIFDGAVRDLSPNAPVLLQGMPVGHVDSVRMIVTDEGATSVEVTFRIEPKLIVGAQGLQRLGAGRDGFDRLMQKMVGRGLRASLMSANLLTGSKMIALTFHSDAPAARLKVDEELPVLPTAAGGDIDGVMVSAQNLLDQMGKLPLGGLIEDMRRTIRATGDTISSPEVKRSLRSLDATLANLVDVSNQAKTDLPPTLHSLRTAASSMEATLAGTEGQPGLGDLMEQLTGAAQSLRSLADYLEQHPEALIQGKTKP